MSKITPIDLQFQGLNSAIASYLIETTAGPVLIESGPHSSFDHLSAGIQKSGYQVADIKHVFLTHIHLDHAGAAWAFAEAGATIHVHPLGIRHLHEPSKLMASAKMIYQDQMDTLWGQMLPIAQSQLNAVDDDQIIKVGDCHFKSIHTPGHAKHHIAWQLDNDLFTGDVAGVKIGNGPVQAPCPPPDIDIEAWQHSIEKIRALNPDTLYLTHFGAITAVEKHLGALSESLLSWSSFIHDHWKKGLPQEDILTHFRAFAQKELESAGLNPRQIQEYEAANPAWMSVAGLLRYWNKKI